MLNHLKLKGILSGVSLSAVLLGTPVQAETLEEALAYTYVANPTILSQRAYLRSVYEKITQSFSGYKPTLSGEASYGYSYTRTKSSPVFNEEESMPFTFGVNAVQPVFSGFGTSASVKAAKAQFEAERANLRNVEQSSLVNSVAAYTDVIRALAVLKLNQNNEAVLQRQLEYTQDRFRVGELTKTDVAQAEARHAGAVAGRISAEGDLKVAYAVYKKAIGKMPDKIYEPEVPTAKLPQTLDDALEIALKSNPLLQSAEMQANSALSSIDVAQSDYYPSVDIQASYRNMKAGAHGSYDLGARTVETGRAREEDTSVMLVMDVPLYRAGNTSSKVRESKYIAGQARINVNAVKRDVVRDTTQAWENYQSTLASLASLEEQVRASALALEGVRYEEQAGTRTILDVLNAEQELLDARVSVVTAKKNLIDASYQLIASMGLMTPSGLGLDIARYRKKPAAAQSESAQTQQTQPRQDQADQDQPEQNQPVPAAESDTRAG